MRKFAIVLLAALLSIFPAVVPQAGLDPTQPDGASSDFELVVLEAEGCTYCSLFRRDVLPAFEASERGRRMSVRFLDINDIETSALDLASAVEIVPTFVVARANKEIGRIPGYVGPENFYHTLDYLMATAP